MDEKEAKKKTFTSNEKLKANRASETEEQIKERLRLGREKDRARRIIQNYKRKIKGRQKHTRPRETAPGHSQKIEAM